MPAAAHNELPTTHMSGTVEITSAQWGDMTVGFEKMAPQDFGPEGCPLHHWGYLLTGKLLVRFADREETVEAGQAFYMEPGHVVEVLEACEELAFTPSARVRELLDAERRNAQATPPSS
jgi:hypothetical protein